MQVGYLLSTSRLAPQSRSMPSCSPHTDLCCHLVHPIQIHAAILFFQQLLLCPPAPPAPRKTAPRSSHPQFKPILINQRLLYGSKSERPACLFPACPDTHRDGEGWECDTGCSPAVLMGREAAALGEDICGSYMTNPDIYGCFPLRL